LPQHGSPKSAPHGTHKLPAPQTSPAWQVLDAQHVWPLPPQGGAWHPPASHESPVGHIMHDDPF
jgi:hypothetical protein